MQSQVSNEQTGWNTLGGQSHPPQFLYAKSSKLLFERRRLCGLHLRLSASAKNFSCYTVSVNRHLEFQNSNPKGLKAIIIINPTNLDNFGCFPTNVISSAQDKTMAIADRCLLSIFDSSAYSGLEPVSGIKSMTQIQSIVVSSIQFSGLKRYLLRLTAT